MLKIYIPLCVCLFCFLIGSCKPNRNHIDNQGSSQKIDFHEELYIIDLAEDMDESKVLRFLQNMEWAIDESGREAELVFRGVSQYEKAVYSLSNEANLQLWIDEVGYVASIEIEDGVESWERILAPYPSVELLNKIHLRWSNLNDNIRLKDAFSTLGLTKHQSFFDLAYSVVLKDREEITSYLRNIPNCQHQLLLRSSGENSVLEYIGPSIEHPIMAVNIITDL